MPGCSSAVASCRDSGEFAARLTLPDGPRMHARRLWPPHRAASRRSFAATSGHGVSYTHRRRVVQTGLLLYAPKPSPLGRPARSPTQTHASHVRRPASRGSSGQSSASNPTRLTVNSSIPPIYPMRQRRALGRTVQNACRVRPARTRPNECPTRIAARNASKPSQDMHPAHSRVRLALQKLDDHSPAAGTRARVGTRRKPTQDDACWPSMWRVRPVAYGEHQARRRGTVKLTGLPTDRERCCPRRELVSMYARGMTSNLLTIDEAADVSQNSRQQRAPTKL